MKNDLLWGVEMNTKKRITVGLLVFLLLVPTFFISSWGWDYMRANQALNNFSKIVEQGDLSGLSLTIYYINPSTFTNPMWRSVDDLIRMSEERKIVISGSELEEHIDLFKRISSDDLVPVSSFMRIPLYVGLFFKDVSSCGLLAALYYMRISTPLIDVRMYYMFECKENGKLFDVAIWGYEGIIVNGFEVEDNDIFYEIVIPFLPEDAAERWGRLIDIWEW